MRNLGKYKGIILAFYACYDDEGKISPERTQMFTQYLIDKGVKGLYVCGSSGERIYQSKEEKKIILENVMRVVKGKTTTIAHVGCNNTRGSEGFAEHVEGIGADAIAPIPPIYFHLPDYSIAEYWSDISNAAPNTDFIIYNILQLVGVGLGINLYKQILKNPRVVSVKNSSMPVQDIQTLKDISGDESVVFNGPDEQFVARRIMGADGSIGGTYTVMPELSLVADKASGEGDLKRTQDIQHRTNRIIYEMCSRHGNLYGVMKETLKGKGTNTGGVRKPLSSIVEPDKNKVKICSKLIDDAIGSLD